jgi:hypothetical protein
VTARIRGNIRNCIETSQATLTYPGYELRVPASWPVYRLDEKDGEHHPVYIGGANAACAYGNLSANWIGSAQGRTRASTTCTTGPSAASR